MKKILYLHAGAEMYGADKALLDLISGLDKTIFEPHVIWSNDRVLVKVLQEVGAKVSITAYPILRRKSSTPKGIYLYGRHFLRYSNAIIKYGKENKIDIVHNNTTAVLEGAYVAKKLNVPLLWHIHEIIVSPKMIYHFLSYVVSKNATKVIAVSEAVKEHYLASKFWKKNKGIDVIYNGVDSAHYVPYSHEDIVALKEKYELPRDSKVIGMIGRVNAWKGQMDFLKAVEPILKNNKNIYAMMVGGVFAGEEWRMEELISTVKKSTVAEQIIVRDYDPNTVDIYNLYDVFVLPSTNPEPFGMVVAEAMSCGKPVIGYKHGGVCEMVKTGYNGELAEVRNTDDLSRKIEKVILDGKLRERYSKNSLTRVREYFSRDTYVTKFEKKYRELVPRKVTNNVF